MFQHDPRIAMWGDPVTDYPVLLSGGPFDGQLISLIELVGMIVLVDGSGYRMKDVHDGVWTYEWIPVDE